MSDGACFAKADLVQGNFCTSVRGTAESLR